MRQCNGGCKSHVVLIAGSLTFFYSPFIEGKKPYAARHVSTINPIFPFEETSVITVLLPAVQLKLDFQ